MKGPLLPLGITLAGAVVYHVSSKSVPRGVHPVLAISAAYLTALGACAILLAISRPGAPASSLREMNWAVAGLGLGAFLIEVGFLWAYRSGWPLNSAAVVVNVSVALALVPIGWAMFAERVSVGRLAGILLCLVGLILLSRE
jgi:drug/metabolite transporter (DMT)-like permease